MKRDYEKKVKALRRLLWGEGDIRAARELVEWMLNNAGAYTARCRRGLEAGVVVTYARPFGENQGLGALPKKFSEFKDLALQKFHEKLINSRNYVAAHNDRINLNSLLSTDALLEDPHKVEIEILANGTSEWITKYPYLEEPVLKRIVELCQVQENRLHEEASNIIGGKSYDPGTFTLGDNFP